MTTGHPGGAALPGGAAGGCRRVRLGCPRRSFLLLEQRRVVDRPLLAPGPSMPPPWTPGSRPAVLAGIGAATPQYRWRRATPGVAASAGHGARHRVAPGGRAGSALSRRSPACRPRQPLSAGPGRSDRRRSPRPARSVPPRRHRCSLAGRAADTERTVGHSRCGSPPPWSRAIRGDGSAGRRATRSTRPGPRAPCSACATSPPSAGRAAAGHAARPGSLAGVLASSPRPQGFDLRAALEDDVNAPLFERLKAYAIASGFRFREIALDGLVAEAGRPALPRHRGRQERRRSFVLARFGAGAPSIPRRGRTAVEQPWPRRCGPPDTCSTRRCPTRRAAGTSGGSRPSASAATSAACWSPRRPPCCGLLMPVATGAILGIAVPDGRLRCWPTCCCCWWRRPLAHGLPGRARVSLIRLGTHRPAPAGGGVGPRDAAAHVLLPAYSVGDLRQRILGIDTIRRILTGATLNALIGGVFSLANLAHHADLRCLADAVRRRLRPASPAACCSCSAASRCDRSRMVLERGASSPAC